MSVLRSMPILIVDDYPVMRRVLHHLLDRLRFEQVDEAGSADEALGLLRSRPYGLLMTDWNMEPTNGLELLRTVRRDAVLGTLPVILFTASTESSLGIEAVKAGANGFMVKPFTARALEDAIARACSGSVHRAA